MDNTRLRTLLIAVAALAVLGFGYALYSAVQEENKQERWDILAKLRREGEPAIDRDPLWFNPGGILNPERAAYISTLEAFLDKTAKGSGDALEPQTRFVIAKTIADHLLSNPGILDQEERGAFYAKAVANLEAIRDQFPDFPLNWTVLSEEGFPSLTRQFIEWLKQNQAWEREHMLQPREPAPDVRVLIRTDRGDLLVGLYSELAPSWTKNFVSRCIAGTYDGTAFFSKREIGDLESPEEHTVRAGGSMTRGMEPFAVEAHKAVAETSTRSGLLPEESRNRIPHRTGVMSAWHDPADEYDHAEQFILCAADSPNLDYNYTPVGKLLDTDEFKSTETLARIFGGDTWSADKDVRDNAELRPVMDLLQAPVRIVKVLVYQGGALQEPTEGAAPTKAEVLDKERALSSIEVDRYQAEAPKPPAKEDEPKKGDDDPDLPPLKDG